MMLPRHGTEQGLTSHRKSGGEIPHRRLAPVGRLPTAVDWRGSGADNVVKDQATCGSCWAFGTTATLQSAYWMATGGRRSALKIAHSKTLTHHPQNLASLDDLKSGGPPDDFTFHVCTSYRMQGHAAYLSDTGAGKMERFSEQQLTDCSWKFGANHACDGGDCDNAIDYLVTMGGIAREDDYEYLGQDNFCSREYMAYTHERDMKLIKVKVSTRLKLLGLILKDYRHTALPAMLKGAEGKMLGKVQTDG